MFQGLFLRSIRRVHRGTSQLDFRDWLGILLFLAAATTLSLRQYEHLLDPTQPHSHRWGMADFRDVVYYPARAFFSGDNPYNVTDYLREYPAGYPFPLYSPGLLIVCIPLTILPWEISLIVYWCVNLALYPVAAYVCLSLAPTRSTAGRVFLLAAILLVSTPGRANFNAGQVTLPVILGAWFAVYQGSHRPILAAVGLTIAILKPTFGVPLAILLLARRQYRVVAVASGLSCVLALTAVSIIQWNIESGSFIHTVLDNQALVGSDPMVEPTKSHTRIDVMPLLMRWLGPAQSGAVTDLGVMALVLCLSILAILSVHRFIAPATVTDASHTFVLCATLVCVHHQVYDSLLLAAPCLILLANPLRGHSKTLNVLIGILFLVPAVNLLWAPLVLRTFGVISPDAEPSSALQGTFYWDIASTLNSAALVAGALLCVPLMRRQKPHSLESTGVTPLGCPE